MLIIIVLFIFRKLIRGFCTPGNCSLPKKVNNFQLLLICSIYEEHYIFNIASFLQTFALIENAIVLVPNELFCIYLAH